MPKTYTICNSLLKKEIQYHVIDSCFGDLNYDHHEDVALIFEESDPDTLKDAPGKLLMLLLGNKNDSVFIAACSMDAICSSGCWGTTPDNISVHLEITNGSLVIIHGYASMPTFITEHTFKYSIEKENWFLYAYETLETCSDPEDIKVYTQQDLGNISFTEFSIWQ